MIRAVVGAGGKTSYIKKESAQFLKQGLRVLVLTSTHMYIEKDTLLTDDPDVIIRELERSHYVMAGIPEGEKIGPLSRKTYEAVCPHADVVLIEADGSKHLPVKFPGANEPVIYDNVDEIVVICGLHALGQKLSDAAHRLELVKACLGKSEEDRMDASDIQKLVMKGYVEPLRLRYPEKKVLIKPNHDQSDYQKKIAELMESEQSVTFDTKAQMFD